MALEECDYNGNGNLDECEVFDCLVAYETAWRVENCPAEYGVPDCDCTIIITTCPDEWTCGDIDFISEEVMNYYDTNGDGSINLGDEIESSHLSIMIDECDQDGNESIDRCEVYDCLIKVENDWRMENCPGYTMLNCNNPYCYDDECPDAWDCDDVKEVTIVVMEELDTDGSGYVDSGDNLDNEHFAMIVNECD